MHPLRFFRPAAGLRTTLRDSRLNESSVLLVSANGAIIRSRRGIVNSLSCFIRNDALGHSPTHGHVSPIRSILRNRTDSRKHRLLKERYRKANRKEQSAIREVPSEVLD